MTLFSLRGVVPSIPDSFEKNHFWPVGFCHFRPQGAQAMVPYRRNGIFRGQNFQIFKNLRKIDIMSPMKSVNGEGVFLCLWAGPGLFKSTFFAIFNGKTLRRGSSFTRSFLKWGRSYLAQDLSIYRRVGLLIGKSIGRSCIFYLGVVKVEVIGIMLK